MRPQLGHLDKDNFKTALRSKIQKLNEKPNADLLATEEFCAILNVDYEKRKGYVRAERYRPSGFRRLIWRR